MSIYEKQQNYIGNERLRKSSYKEYQPGDTLAFTLNTLDPNGALTTSDKEITIKEVRGGGFFGKVLIPQEDVGFVIKTSLPDPWHHFWRIVNWDYRDVPARTSEKQTQLEHLATRIIHNSLPILTDGKFKSPSSFGYTKLATGYAQVVEKMNGRGPRYDLSENEFVAFQQAQQELLELGFSLGLEQVGQIHPDNPFAMANLWYEPETGSFIWLNTTPAILHKGFIWPFFRFDFHYDIRRKFRSEAPTFNRIHTDHFFAALYRNRHKFTPDLFEQIKTDLRLYRKIWGDVQEENNESDRKAAMEAFGEFAKEALTERFVFKMLADSAFRREKIEILARLIKDPEYRTLFYNDNFVLRGIERARRDRIITEDEWRQAWQAVENYESDPNRKWVLGGIQTYYLLIKGAFDAYEWGMYATSPFSENPLAQAVFAFITARMVPPVLRASGTIIADRVTNIDLKTAALVSATPIIPFVGTVFPIPAQVAMTEGRKAKSIWHYTLRELATTVSKIHPAGGRGSKVEGVIWEKAGKKLEKLGSPKD